MQSLELTPDVIRVEATHKSNTKSLLLEMQEETDNGCNCELSWTTTKANVFMDTTNERGKMGRD